jgi:hypothetical protein
LTDLGLADNNRDDDGCDAGTRSTASF